ncbi:MAG: zinc ribbon domain-containing protein [Anaerolineae bacterium]|nr:zinc ribbon domain-containing protein [Anaerolineae bacterium]
MPLYEYYCADCRDTFEALRPMSKADAPIQCKSCESMKTSRALSLFATHTGSSSSAPLAASSMPRMQAGGGCCGGACTCGH